MNHGHSLKRKEPTSNAPPTKKSRNGRRNIQALNGTFNITSFPANEGNERDMLVFFEESRRPIAEELQAQLQRMGALKWNAVFHVQMNRTTQDGEEEVIRSYFRSDYLIELTESSISEHMEEAFAKILKSFEKFSQMGSGWALDRILKLEICTAKYHPLAASSYMALPDKLRNKHALINIVNLDQKCLVWSLLAQKHPVDRLNHANRVSNYEPFEAEIKLGDIQCPVPLSRIPQVETLNDIRINVFTWEKEEVIPLHISDREDDECFNLMLISNEINHHYCLIKNFSALMFNQTKHKGARFFCYRCLHGFCREDLLKEHIPYCKAHSPQKIKMPRPEDSIMKFNKHHYQHAISYIIYADFESILVPISSAEPSIKTSFSNPIHLHQACGYAYLIVGPDGRCHKSIQCYRGENAVDHFLKKIMEEKEELAKILIKDVPIQMTKKDEEDFKKATRCYLCKELLFQDKCADHDHLDGHYRGALHSSCNLKYRLRKLIPVVFHNLKSYDAHLIMQGLGKIEKHQFHVIANNLEKYISFSITKYYLKKRVCLQFIDSCQFLTASLESLVANLEADDFKLLKANMPSAHIELLLRKGVYPYEYMSSFSKFSETSLPPKEAFFSSLTQQHITDEDYAHAQKVWGAFSMHNMGDYHDLYVKSDVLQLADVFQNFRVLCAQYYELDCAHLLTAPGLAWEASMKMCKQPLELLTDLDMHLMIERGIRGGVAMISQRWACANHSKSLNPDPAKPSSYIMYMDANNLYGHSMCEPLPYGEFQWIKPEDIAEDLEEFKNWIMALDEYGAYGYIFEVDLEYPSGLHDLHNEYPLAAEKIRIKKEMLSPYTLNLIEKMPYVPTEKLVPNLMNKSNYVVHYRNLKYYLSLGMELQKMHRIIEFKQRAWLKPYIAFNTEKRKEAKSSFEKNFFKLMNNAVYGKTMESVRRRVDVQLVNTEKRAEKLVASPRFKSFKIFDQELVGVQRIKASITLDKPIYAGFTILELSKLHMYKFHYDYIKSTYGDRAHLLFTDTDSLTYHIQTPDVYKDMALRKDLFDTSDYPQTHDLYSTENKKKIGCFKDELNSRPVYEFVGLRAKMYSILSEEGEKKVAKGVTRPVVNFDLKHESYKEALFQQKFNRKIQHTIESDNHQISTIRKNKVALSPVDDKRYVLDDGVHTLAYGHFKIT